MNDFQTAAAMSLQFTTLNTLLSIHIGTSPVAAVFFL